MYEPKENLKWFNLNNYTQPLSREDWALNILLRAQIVRNRNNEFKINKSDIHIFDLLKDTPTFKIKESILSTLHPNHTNTLYKTLESHFNDKSAIFVRTLKEHEDYYSSIIKMIQTAYGHDEDSPSKLYDELRPSYMQKEVIAINLNIPNVEIIREFKKFLKEKRKQVKYIVLHEESVDAKLQELHDLRLLAVFDLLVFKHNFDPTITDLQIGDLVWPYDQIELEQRIRKKCKPLIKKIFHFSVASQLYSFK